MSGNRLEPSRARSSSSLVPRVALYGFDPAASGSELEGFRVSVVSSIAKLLDRAYAAHAIVVRVAHAAKASEIAACLRASGARAPIVLVSEWTEDARSDAFWAGADECLDKCADFRDLSALLRALTQEPRGSELEAPERKPLKLGDLSLFKRFVGAPTNSIAYIEFPDNMNAIHKHIFVLRPKVAAFGFVLENTPGVSYQLKYVGPGADARVTRR